MSVTNAQSGVSSPLTVADFSGGITDNFVSGPVNQYRFADNFLVTDDGTLDTRPGTVIYDGDNPQIPLGNVRISGYMRTNDNFFQVGGRHFYSQVSGSFQELLGPTGNPVLPTGDNLSQFDFSNFNETYIVTSTEFGSPMKVFPDENGDYQVVTAGLPSVQMTSAISFANEMKARFNLHVNSALIHTGAGGDDPDNAITSADATNLSSLLSLVNELSENYTAHLADALLVVPDHHTATGTNYALASTDAVTTLTEANTRLLDLRTKYNQHNADAVAHAVFVPAYAVSLSFVTEPVFTGTAGANQYLYSLVAFYEYTAGTRVFRDYGPTHLQLVTSVNAPDVNAITISSIPVITNSTTENYDTVSIKWLVYRSENQGQTLYEVGSVLNGTTTFIDNRSDSSIVSDNITLYTTGGILDNDPPPEAKYVVIVNGIAWYAHIKEGSEIKNNRVRQSVKDDIDSCPATFFTDFEDEVTGIRSVNIFPIVFCKNRMFRLEGFIDEFGEGIISKREISKNIGAVNHKSIVNVTVPDSGEEGLVFASTDGFYFTDGFNIIKISDAFNKRYKTLVRTATQKKYIYGEFDRENDRVYWCLSDDDGVMDNNAIYVYDMDFGIKKEGVFTRLESHQDSWRPTAISYDHLGNLVLGDTRGFSFKFQANQLTDPRIDLSATVADWRVKQVEWNYESCSMAGGDPSIRKWLNLININMENRTNISLSPQYDVENSGNFREIKEIRLRENITWGDFSVLWQTSTPQTPVYPWNTFPYVQQKRRFVSGKLRVNFLTIRLTNSETIITNSDTLGEAGVVGQVVTLVPDPITATWPEDVTDYKIAFEDDGYETLYPINSRTSDTEIVIVGTAPSGAGQKWHLVGVAKGEAFNLIDYTVHWQAMTPSFIPYRASSSGANA